MDREYQRDPTGKDVHADWGTMVTSATKSSNYARIREDHVRDYGEKTTWRRRLLAELYSDRSQFIFELIQNAEDAGATKIQFSLEAQRLVVLHNGRLFTEGDVRSICAIAESAKPDSPGQIGRFGIGFKSVYAYTERPHIHCPPEHFCIEEFVWPRAVTPVEPGPGWTTRFEFPFDRSEIPAAKSVDEIASALGALSPRTLLFLSSVDNLTWSVQGATRSITRESKQASLHFVTVSKTREPTERWALFRAAVPITDTKTLHVELGFLVVSSLPDGAQRVRPAARTELVAFFPTKRSTHLGFVLQAPFVLNTSRENVHEKSSVNIKLVNRAATLLVDALEQLRDEGLLDGLSIEVLPLELRHYPPESFLHPLYEAVRLAIRNKPLLPTHDGEWAGARSLRAARSRQIRDLFTAEQLTALLRSNVPLSWISSTFGKETPKLQAFLVGHRPAYPNPTDPIIQPLIPDFEIRIDGLLRALSPDFLAKQPDEWMCRLYALLARQNAEISGLRSMAIIRTETGAHVSLLDGSARPAVWLPPTGPTAFPIVKRSIVADPEAKKFMTSLGLTLPDEADDLIRTLEQAYDIRDHPPEEVHIALIRRLAETLTTAAPQKRKLLIETAQSLPMVRAINAATRAEAWLQPRRTYLVEDMGLREFLQGENDAWLLVEDGQPAGFWAQLGVRTSPVVHYGQPNADGSISISRVHSDHQRGLRGFDPDFDIDGLSRALQSCSIPKARFLWRLLAPYARTLHGIVQYSSRKDFSNARNKQKASKAGELLRARKWLPDRAGQFHVPSELSLEDLPSDFEQNEQLAHGLGMVAAGSRDQIARALGVDQAQVSILLSNRGRLAEFIELVAREPIEKHASAARVAPEAHLAARQQLGGEDVYIDDELPASGPRTTASVAAAVERSLTIPKRVRTEIKTKFATLLSTDAAAEKENAVLEVMADYAGRCQICGRTFVQRDGTHSCQIAQLQPAASAGGLTTAGNLALVCGWHAALLREGRFTFFGDKPISPDELRRRVLDADRCIEIVFHCVLSNGERMTSSVNELIRYSGPHWEHLQAFLRAGAI